MGNKRYKLREQRIDYPKVEDDTGCDRCSRRFAITMDMSLDLIVVYGFVRNEFVNNKM